MELVYIALVFIASFALCLVPFSFFIKRKPWTSCKKKTIFSFGGAAIVFPVLLPAMMLIPMPHIFFLGIYLFDFEILEMFQWYGRTFIFNVVSYVITTAILGLISQVVFFEYKGHQKHGL